MGFPLGHYFNTWPTVQQYYNYYSAAIRLDEICFLSFDHSEKYELISLGKIKYWNQLYTEVKSPESITR